MRPSTLYDTDKFRRHEIGRPNSKENAWKGERTARVMGGKKNWKTHTTPLGIEPRISGSVDQRLIHWAMEPSCNMSISYTVFVSCFLFWGNLSLQIFIGKQLILKIMEVHWLVVVFTIWVTSSSLHCVVSSTITYH